MTLTSEGLRRRIREARKLKGWTQADLADHIGVSPTTVTDWETGKARPWENLVKLADTLSVSTDWLLTGRKREKYQDVPLTFESLEFKNAEVPNMHDLPVVGKVAADHMPSFAEAKEFQPVDVRYGRKNHYCLICSGRSMHPTMSEGDRLVVERVHYHLESYDEMKGPIDKRFWLKLHEEVVCAIVDNNDPVVKRLFIYDEGTRGMGFQMYLQSDNRKVKPIIIKKETDLRIVGIVRDIMRSPKNYE